MTRLEATALCGYLQRGYGVVPTTGAEWTVIQRVLPLIEGVANGRMTYTVAPATPAERPDEAGAAEESTQE
jgi:hypothetical protein